MIPKTEITIIPNKYYYLADTEPPKDIPKAFFFNVDHDLTYEGYYQDFGPLNIAKIWKYINEIYKFLNDSKYSQNIFYHFTSPHFSKCTNSALLICSYMVVIMNKTPEEAFEPFKNVEFRPFRDSASGQCSYKCTILDCLRGLAYAIKIKWFDFKTFDIVEYEHYQQIENGDLNWIIPHKFIAFSSPYADNQDSTEVLLTPKDYVPIFKKLEVSSVIRLNQQFYCPKDFKQNGINHYELYFTDGTCPSLEIVNKFLELSQHQKGALAVHCKAGLGRTCTLIACYAIKHYHFNAADLIGWIRLCRPGSILGPQQYFLIEHEQYLKKQGLNSPIWKQLKQQLSQTQVVEHMKTMNIKGKMTEQQKLIGSKGDIGQSKRLIEARKRHSLRKMK